MGACCVPGGNDRAAPEPTVAPGRRSTKGQVRIPAGTSWMGDHFDEGFPEDGEVPVHPVTLDAYYLDATAVTNAMFATFVRATGHVTTAETLGNSPVFHLALPDQTRHVIGAVETTPWWLLVEGADWRHPEGPESDVTSRPQHPVVHVSHSDAVAYARWAGKRLPTEAEWEHGARGGLVGQRFAWGNELTPRGRHMCNIWQGRFPVENSLEDGYLTTAPVKAFRPNGYGLHQMAGNVWEWCSDWFSNTYYAEGPTESPTGPADGVTRVMRGGSYLCHDSYCDRYRVAARTSAGPESTAGNLGFRCANDA